MNKYEFSKISPGDAYYPNKLKVLFGELLPPELWFLGNIELLKERSVGFCGSRKASDEGIAVAVDCAKQLSDHGIVVTSGYAAGVDLAAHASALSSGGSTIIVLAEGADHFRIKKQIKDVWDSKRTLVITYFPRNAIWRADRAMDRNKAIVSLSNAVVVIEAGNSGGTLNAGYVALKEKKPLFVATYQDMEDTREGNTLLLHEGGIPLLKSKSSGFAKIDRMLDAIN